MEKVGDKRASAKTALVFVSDSDGGVDSQSME